MSVLACALVPVPPEAPGWQHPVLLCLLKSGFCSGVGACRCIRASCFWSLCWGWGQGGDGRSYASAGGPGLLLTAGAS